MGLGSLPRRVLPCGLCDGSLINTVGCNDGRPLFEGRAYEHRPRDVCVRASDGHIVDCCLDNLRLTPVAPDLHVNPHAAASGGLEFPGLVEPLSKRRMRDLKLLRTDASEMAVAPC